MITTREGNSIGDDLPFDLGDEEDCGGAPLKIAELPPADRVEVVAETDVFKLDGGVQIVVARGTNNDPLATPAAPAALHAASASGAGIATRAAASRRMTYFWSIRTGR